MKKLFTILVAILLTATVFAQTPEKMSYQAVIRNSNDALVTNTQVGMQISILQGSTSGTVVYTETQTPTTNANGLVSIEIGEGLGFSSIDWASDIYFIKTETDPSGGTNYTITGTSQLLSVSYALHAKTAETVTGSVTETDPVFTAWDKSTGISIAESQVSDLGVYLEAEADPVFTAWDKSTAISITESQISDLGTYIETETDPEFTAWDKFTGINITESQISDLQNYLTTESDPAVAANFDFSGAAVGDLLQFDGTKWVKVTPSYIETEADPEFTAWDKDYADLINTPATITTEQADAIVDNTAKNSYPETDKTKLADIEADAQVNVQADWNATAGDALILNKPVIPEAADGSESKVTAGTNVTVTGSGTAANPYVVNASGATTYSVGDFAQGGIVFWVDETGQHGLVCAKEDQSTGVRWSAGTNGNTQAKGDGPYAGEANTSIIIAAQVAIGDDGGTYAARICNELQVTAGGKTYGDWYLPSKEELNLMYQNMTIIDATATANSGSSFASSYYWSSLEYTDYIVWNQSFANGNENFSFKTSPFYVRAVRAF